MKKILLLCVAAIGLCACNSNKYVVQGNIEGLEGTVYMIDQTGNPTDSATVEQGKFRFEGVAEVPALRFLRSGVDAVKPLETRAIFIESGKIAVNGNIDALQDIVIGGTSTNEANAAYTKEARILMDRYRAPETTDTERETIDAEYTNLSRKVMSENQNNLLGAVILAQQLSYELNAQETLDAIALFPEVIQKDELLAKLRENAEAKLKTEVGQPYIDVVQNNAAGEVVSLKSVIETPANKYILLDFWASWCGPCMREVPYLIADYKAYHDKGFEIYGVSFDESREKWLAAVEAHGMNWIQVSDLKGFDNPSAKDYGISGIPSNFLIDCATGKIVATNLRGEDLGKKLSELLP